MRFIGNLIWVFLGGLITCLLWIIAGFLLSITIVGLPFAFQCFKIAGFVLWPFGKKIDAGNFGVAGLLGNIIWIVLLGIELAVIHLIIGFLFSITIIGIPFGKQHFKMAKLSLIPFGSVIYR